MFGLRCSGCRQEAPRDVNQVAVVKDGRLVGVLSREDIMRFVEIRRGLGLDTRGG